MPAGPTTTFHMHTMAAPGHETVLAVTDLVDRPGASRLVDLAVDVPDGLSLPLVDVDEPLRLAGVIESVVDGLLVRGRLVAHVRLSCARCLAAVEEDVQADVVEHFAVPAGLDEDPEVGYEIHEGTIDLDTLLRDALAPATPYQPLCRADCLGLCASCGANRNEVSCDCADRDTDPRWAPLAGLRLPPELGDA